LGHQWLESGEALAQATPYYGGTIWLRHNAQESLAAPRPRCEVPSRAALPSTKLTIRQTLATMADISCRHHRCRMWRESAVTRRFVEPRLAGCLA
jgi:hypothetical protein